MCKVVRLALDSHAKICFLLMRRVQTNSSLHNVGAGGDNMPFDLMCNSSEANRHMESRRNPLILPLDLPGNVSADDDGDGNAAGGGGCGAMNLHQRLPRRLGSTNDIPLDLTARNDHFVDRLNRTDSIGKNHFY